MLLVCRNNGILDRVSVVADQLMRYKACDRVLCFPAYAAAVGGKAEAATFFGEGCVRPGLKEHGCKSGITTVGVKLCK